jgi:hypothetical protein
MRTVEGKQGDAKIGVGAYPIRQNVEDTAAELSDYGERLRCSGGDLSEGKVREMEREGRGLQEGFDSGSLGSREVGEGRRGAVLCSAGETVTEVGEASYRRVPPVGGRKEKYLERKGGRGFCGLLG